ncbi:MerR family transcriptional regulator [Streptomyces sp. NPDC056231]|uniref:MerR family transcriptional regulator n=1 Tax=Streptomyces sp. NPDC056231 TaxID=3345755 RepID=UPI003AAF839C
MRLSALSKQSDVSTATINYHLRDGLLTPGERIGAPQTEYDESHLRRPRRRSRTGGTGSEPTGPYATDPGTRPRALHRSEGPLVSCLVVPPTGFEPALLP